MKSLVTASRFTISFPWLPAQVPGHVHLDLMRNGVISDPFRRLYEKDAQWVDESVTGLMRPPFRSIRRPEGDTFLVFHGLDTMAEIHLNDAPLASVDNMFFAPRVCCDWPSCASGKGRRAETDFRSCSGPQRASAPSVTRGGMRRATTRREWIEGDDKVEWNWDLWAAREFVRKAQYMFGWDWGPVLASCGIWQRVDLVTVPVARILDWNYTVDFVDAAALVHVTAYIERAGAHLQTPLTFSAGLPNEEIVSAPVPLGAGRQAVSATLTIHNPIRWETNGMVHGKGDASPHLYTLGLTLSGDKAIEHREARIGLRTIELVRRAGR